MFATRTLLVTAVSALLAGALFAGCARPPAATETVVPPVTPPVADTQAPAPTGTAATGGRRVQLKGSDTLLQVAQALAEAYKAKDAAVQISVTGGGTGTGFQALTEGTTDIADASRKIKDKEIQEARAKGVEPVEHLVGYDGIAVIVSTKSPIQKLTIEQLSDIYTGQVTDWKAVGGSGEIALYSRDTASGTYEYFKEHVVQKGDKASKREYAPTAIMLPSNTAILDEVTKSDKAIGYVGLGYLSDKVKAVPIVDKAGKPVAPSTATVKDGSYPISRPLFMYTAKTPSEPTTAFLDWVTGPDGQGIIAKAGFVPVK